MADEAARPQVFFPIEAPALGLEILQQLVKAFAPVVRAEHQQEVVAADVADEVAVGVDPLVQALGQAQQHLVAPGVAVEVGQRLNSRNSLSVLNGHISR